MAADYQSYMDLSSFCECAYVSSCSFELSGRSSF